MANAGMRWKPFLLIHATALFLLATWLWPPTFTYWYTIDTSVFHYLNGTLHERPLLQIFWAIANVRATDLIGAIFMATFLLLYILDGKGAEERQERLTKTLFLCIWGEIGIFSAKQVLDPIIQSYELMRSSPTILFSDAIMLSEAVPWLKVKDFSRSCFPGDHAEIVLQWTVFVFVVCGVRYGLMALPACIFFILPRLIGGAHWISDAAVGSLTIVLCVLAWALYSPLHYYTMRLARCLARWITHIITTCIRALQ